MSLRNLIRQTTHGGHRHNNNRGSQSETNKQNLHITQPYGMIESTQKEENGMALYIPTEEHGSVYPNRRAWLRISQQKSMALYIPTEEHGSVYPNRRAWLSKVLFSLIQCLVH